MSLSTTSILILALKELSEYEPLDEHPRSIATKALEAYERLKHNGVGEVVYLNKGVKTMASFSENLNYEFKKGKMLKKRKGWTMSDSLDLNDEPPRLYKKRFDLERLAIWVFIFGGLMMFVWGVLK